MPCAVRHHGMSCQATCSMMLLALPSRGSYESLENTQPWVLLVVRRGSMTARNSHARQANVRELALTTTGKIFICDCYPRQHYTWVLNPVGMNLDETLRSSTRSRLLPLELRTQGNATTFRGYTTKLRDTGPRISLADNQCRNHVSTSPRLFRTRSWKSEQEVQLPRSRPRSNLDDKPMFAPSIFGV